MGHSECDGTQAQCAHTVSPAHIEEHTLDNVWSSSTRERRASRERLSAHAAVVGYATQ